MARGARALAQLPRYPDGQGAAHNACSLLAARSAKSKKIGGKPRKSHEAKVLFSNAGIFDRGHGDRRILAAAHTSWNLEFKVNAV